MLSKSSNAVQFDCINDHIAVPVAGSLDISSSITIEAWANYSNTAGTQDLVGQDVKSKIETNTQLVQLIKARS